MLRFVLSILNLSSKYFQSAIAVSSSKVSISPLSKNLFALFNLFTATFVDFFIFIPVTSADSCLYLAKHSIAIIKRSIDIIGMQYIQALSNI